MQLCILGYRQRPTLLFHFIHNMKRTFPWKFLNPYRSPPLSGELRDTGTIPAPETYYLTDDEGNILTDDAGNRLTWL